MDGRITGTGEIRLPNQDIYYGEFVDNEFNGQGIPRVTPTNFLGKYKWYDGRTYTGEW